jgi:hypothetical protein
VLQVEPEILISEGIEGLDNEWFDEDYGLSHTRREAAELRLQQLQIEQEVSDDHLRNIDSIVPYWAFCSRWMFISIQNSTHCS